MLHNKFILSLLFLIFFVIPVNATSKFLVLCTTACTWDNTNDTIWSTSSGGANNTTHPTSADTVTLDANSCVGGLTCTITVNANITLAATVPALTMGACTASTAGCVLDFSANNNTISLGGFSSSGTGTRTLNMGSNTWTFTGVSGTLWNTATTTNFTFNSNTSTILLSAVATSTRSLGFHATGGNMGSLNNLTVTNASWSPYDIDLTANFASPTFAGNVTLTNVGGFKLTASLTCTISGTFTYTNSSTNQGLLYATGASTMSFANAPSLAWLLIRNITKAGAAGNPTATNSFDGGGNTNITITGPSGGGGRIIGG